MQKKDEYTSRFQQDLTEDQSGGVPSDFGADEQEDLYSRIMDRLAQVKQTEDNVDLITSVHDTLESISEDYEQAANPDEWNEVLERLENEAIVPLENDDIDAADVSWTDIKIELMRLRRD